MVLGGGRKIIKQPNFFPRTPPILVFFKIYFLIKKEGYSIN